MSQTVQCVPRGTHCFVPLENPGKGILIIVCIPLQGGRLLAAQKEREHLKFTPMVYKLFWLCDPSLKFWAAAAAKSLQSCPTLCDPTDGSPPGSPVPGILQARRLEWVAISFSNAWKWKVKVKLLIRVRLLATPWTAAYQAPPSMGFSRRSTGVGCHCLFHIYIPSKN